MSRGAALGLAFTLLGGTAAGGDPATSFSLASSAFPHQGEIPRRYTCDGDDTSPPLSWSGAPDGTESFALVVVDPDAPDPRAPLMTWVHWILYDLPSTARELPAGVMPAALPAGTREGENDWQRTGYGGPCPPIGRHRYVHQLHALDTTLPDLGTPTRAQLEEAMAGHVLGRAELIGTYRKEAR